MPRPNVELVQRIYDAFRRGDLNGVLQFASDDIEILQSTEVPWGGRYRGYSGMKEFAAKLRSKVATVATPMQWIDARDHVAAVGRTEGTLVGVAEPQTFSVPFVPLWKSTRARWCECNSASTTRR
jgi:uncharacterized protein